jgi:hypothetical protein
MQIEKYDRKPFSVLAVQVTFKNVLEVAEWCKGTVITQKTKMLGVETEIPAIRVEGQGDNRGKSFVATLGCYVVELKGSFRVYKPAQFDSSFQVAVDPMEDLDTCSDPISLVKLQENATSETKAEWAEDDNSSVDGQETAQIA